MTIVFGKNFSVLSISAHFDSLSTKIKKTCIIFYMNKLNPVPEIIREKIKSLDTVFVFPTQIPANLWADWAISNTDTKAVPMERFIAWDDFKGEAIKSKQQNRRSIPGAMRTIFSADLIEKNSKKKFLSYIVAKEFAESASSFTEWVAGILPSLAMWKKLFDSKKLTPDDEDRDYMEIYSRYKNFLDAHGLFDPAWETPPFDPQGKRYVIFFPEIIMDYLEYRDVLESADEIEIIHVPDAEQKPAGHFYSNSRAELRQVCLWLKKNHDEKKIGWQDMALSAPDLETWWPYIDREMDLYGIPHVQKNGSPLTSSPAGNFFRQIQSCVSENFSFESIKNLLLNTALPWTDFDLNQRLIRFGQENNCICSFENGADIWEKSFAEPFDGNGVDQRLIEMYHALKNILTSIVRAKSFDEIRTNYFTFRTHFFDVENFTENSDRIISRCISELGSLIDLENDFQDCTVPSHYSFFVDFISGKNYVPQTEDQGVQILPYRLSAPAPFRIQAVIDSSQASLSVIYRQLAFLNDEKRLNLGFGDDANVSDLFIRLYNLNSIDGTIFTAAEKTFTGYALVSAYLDENDLRKTNNLENLDSQDPYIAERESLLDKNIPLPKKIMATAKNGFESWKTMQELDENQNPYSDAEDKIAGLIDERLTEDGKVKITYSRLKSFYDDCHSFMEKYVLGLEEETSAADLTKPFLIGNLNHKILEIYCKSLLKKSLPLSVDENKSLDEKRLSILRAAINEAIDEIQTSVLSRQLIFSSIKNIEEQMVCSVTAFSETFCGYEIHAVEKSYKYFPEEKNYFFDGKIDCILKDPLTGECVLIDFKTSEKAIPSDSFFADDEVIVPDFQMPIYIYLLENQRPPLLIENCAFYNITDAKIVPVIGELVGADNALSLSESTRRFLSQAEFYAEKVLSHDIDSNPAAELWLESQTENK